MEEIVTVSESQTNVVYKVVDHTGPLVDVKKWLYDQKAEADQLAGAGVCVCVCVHVCACV